MYINVEDYLSSDLIPEESFASRLGMPPSCLRRVVNDGLFPQPKPVQVNNRYYFTPWMQGAWLSYLWNYAENQEIARIADILRAHDPRRLDYRDIDPDETTRDWLLAVLEANTAEEYRP